MIESHAKYALKKLWLPTTIVGKFTMSDMQTFIVKISVEWWGGIGEGGSGIGFGRTGSILQIF